jgi:hypothetical protein
MRIYARKAWFFLDSTEFDGKGHIERLTRGVNRRCRSGAVGGSGNSRMIVGEVAHRGNVRVERLVRAPMGIAVRIVRHDEGKVRRRVDRLCQEQRLESLLGLDQRNNHRLPR